MQSNRRKLVRRSFMAAVTGGGVSRGAPAATDADTMAGSKNAGQGPPPTDQDS